MADDKTKAKGEDKVQTPNDTKTIKESSKDEHNERQAELLKEEGKKSQSNDDGDRFTSLDTFENPAEKTLANTQTVQDRMGIERIVAPLTSTFAPAPLEATDEQKKAAERRQAMFKDASEKRQASLTDEIKDEDRMPNNQADGGSQTRPAS